MLLNDLTANTNRTRLREATMAWLQSPGFAVITSWRIARRLHGGNKLAKALATLIWRFGVVSHGCYISLNAHIGPGLRLPHATGIVIGDGVLIGAGVTIYQNVTLGRLREDSPAYPTIADGCKIYAGAVVLGNVTVGKEAQIGANSVVLKDIPAEAVAVGSPARILTEVSI